MKRIIYTLLGMMLSVGAWAQTSLQEQINVATEATTIQLTDDVDLSATTLIIPEGKNITLDLNGYSITSSASGAVAVKNNGTLTVKDTSAEKTGMIKSTYYAGIGVGDNSTTTFESGKIESVEGAIITGKVVGATISINGGTFSASDNAVIMGNGSARDGAANTITINGGTFNGQIKSAGYVACGIYAPWKDVITVNDGTFNITNGCGICARAGSVTVNGGTFNCTGTATGKVGDSRVVVPCSAIVYDSAAGYPAMTAESKVVVPSTSTAVFKSQEGVAAVSVVGESHIEISGGTYSSPLTEDVCADGYIPSNTPNADGTYGAKAGTYVAQIGDVKYASLVEAIAAATDGQTITLIANTIENVTIDAGKIITLDLNGNTLSGGSVASNGKKAAIVNNGTLVVLDSSAEQTGSIKREDDDTGLSASNSYYVIDNHGTMTIKSGNVINNSGLTTAHKGSSLIRNGEPDEAILNIEGGILTQNNYDVIKNGGKGTLNISGGTINSTNSYAVLSYGGMNMTAGTVNGKVCLRSYTDSKEDSHGVGNISGGTINGNITVETYTGNTPNTLSECNISGTAVVTGTLSIGEGNGNTFTADDEKGKFAVSGGTFSYQVPEEYCADGFVPKKNEDGTYGVIEGTYVAKIGEAKYTSLQEAINAATAESTITLLADINEAITNDNTNNFTIDLNGKTWSSDSYTLKNNGGTITIEGAEGTVKSTGVEGIAVWARTGNIIINSGNYENCSNSESTIYVGTTDENLTGKKPTVTINGGTFKNTAEGTYKWNANLKPLTLNIINNIANADAYQAIVINGGTFYGNDPAYGDDSQLGKINNNSNFVSSAYHAEKNSQGVYEIKEGGYTAQLSYFKYVALDEAIEDAKGETTITLLADAETTKEVLPEGVTINANNKVLTMPSFVVLDGQPLVFPKITGTETYKVVKATYIRTNIAAAKWGTVCLPFTLTNGNGASYYTYGSITDNTLTVNETTETIAAHTPLVFSKATPDLEINEMNATVSLTTPESLTSGALIGTYSALTVPAESGTYFINSDKFHQVQASLTVPAYRAYIKYSYGAKPSVLSILVNDGYADGIEAITTEDVPSTAIYDVNGRQIANLQKGLNIMRLDNGKTVKVIVK